MTRLRLKKIRPNKKRISGNVQLAFSLSESGFVHKMDFREKQKFLSEIPSPFQAEEEKIQEAGSRAINSQKPISISIFVEKYDEWRQ